MSNDPGALVQLYDFIRTGQGTLAAGVVLTFLVAAIRHGGFAQFAPTKAWAESKIGGYVLGFGTSAAAYLASAFLASQALTVTLFLNALGAGYVAAGGWEHLQDVLGFIRQTPPPGNKPAVVTLVLAVMLACGFSAGCVKNTRTEVLQATTIGLTAAQNGFDAWNAKHELDIANDPKLTTPDAAHAALAAYRVARAKVIDGFILVNDLISAASVQNDKVSLQAAIDAATKLYADIRQLKGALQGGK